MKPQKIKSYDHAQKKADGIDFTIDQNGNWYTHSSDTGVPGFIQRDKLVKLFAGAGEGIWAGRGLKYNAEKDDYTIATPHVSYVVEVEDLPFVITDYAFNENDVLELETHLGETVQVTADNPIKISYAPYYDQELPEIEVRAGLRARLGRQVYYDLIAKYGVEQNGVIGIESAGYFCALGSAS